MKSPLGALFVVYVAVILVCLVVMEIQAEDKVDCGYDMFKSPKDLLWDAHALLKGKEKDLECAEYLLQKAVGRSRIIEKRLCTSFVYLGYIQDNRGNREKAVQWYDKAVGMGDDCLDVWRELAGRGQEEPIIWMRNLDYGPEYDDPEIKKLVKQFKKAEKMLKGNDKDLEGAQKTLVEIISNEDPELPVYEKTYTYLYLGYIEDLSGNRGKAKEWIEKAMAVNDDKVRGIQRVAKRGLDKPLTKLPYVDREKKNQ